MSLRILMLALSHHSNQNTMAHFKSQSIAVLIFITFSFRVFLDFLSLLLSFLLVSQSFYLLPSWLVALLILLILTTLRAWDVKKKKAMQGVGQRWRKGRGESGRDRRESVSESDTKWGEEARSYIERGGAGVKMRESFLSCLPAPANQSVMQSIPQTEAFFFSLPLDVLYLAGVSPQLGIKTCWRG